MNEFIDSFSNRDIAIIIWTLIFLFVLAYAIVKVKDIRESFGELLKQLWDIKIIIPVLLLVVYIVCEFAILRISGFIGVGQFKDFIYWTIGVALVSLFSIHKIKSISYFRDLLINTTKLTVFVEFIINIYVLSIAWEVILVFLATILPLFKVIADRKEETKSVSNLISIILSIIGYSLLLLVIYNIYVNFKAIPTWENLRTLLIVPIMTLMYLPFLYMVSIYAKYEMLFARINVLIGDICIKKSIKKYIMLRANLNMSSLDKVSKNIHLHDFINETNISLCIKNMIDGK